MMRVALVGALAVAARAEQANPIGKVLQLMSDLQAKILKEGEGAQKVYSEFAEWCEEQSKQLSFEIKTGKADVADLKAAIDQETATIGSLETRLEELSGSLATDEADLKAATHIRTQESTAFAASEKELSETIDTLQRAIGIIEREMKGGASMLQLQRAGGLVQALTVLVEASKLSTADAGQITALLQSSARSEDADVGAPAAAVYENQSGNIVQVLTDLLEEAEDQLGAARRKETKDLHAFEMLKQSLEDEIKYSQKEVDEAKSGIAGAGEKKSKAEGELAMTSKGLAEDIKALGDLHHECMTKAEDFEAETKSRGEELAAIAKAKEVIKENVGGAESLSYGFNQVSFVQASSKVMSSGNAAVRMVRDLAKKHNSPMLTQLAMRLRALSGDDQFAKVKALIQDMIQRLESEAEADAKKKAFCDTELSETEAKKSDKTEEIKKLTTEIDKMSARSATLKEEVAELQQALAALAKSQAEMNKIRAEEKDQYATNSADMEQGLKGVKLALKVLRDYYAKDDKAHDAAEGAGNGIISLLEVVESDFTKGLAQMTSDEEAAQAEYDEQTKENEIEKATKSQDVKYKTKESTDLDKAAAEASSDRSGVQEELAAVQKYLDELHEQCDEKAETFEERKARYESEIAGLKEALQVLESETALIQRGSLRGVKRHVSGV